jgi:hypothetical protein
MSDVHPSETASHPILSHNRGRDPALQESRDSGDLGHPADEE